MIAKLKQLVRNLFKTIWDSSPYPEHIKLEIKQAIWLKKVADKYDLPVEIRIDSLGISYWYDPLDRKLKKQKLKLLQAIKSRLEQRARSENLNKLMKDIENIL